MLDNRSLRRVPSNDGAQRPRPVMASTAGGNA